MNTFVRLLGKEQAERLPARAREVVEYRKSGLSLNHIQGCPLDCAYCIRHTYGLWDQRQPRALMSDAEAVERLVSHRYFQAHVTPVQVFNRATDPFLPAVRPHTLAVLADLDGRGLRNHVLVITRHQMKPGDIARLNQLANLKVTLLFTYSGIDDKRIEPYPSQVAADSLKLMSVPGRRRYRTVLYWRPLAPGLNDTDEHLARAYALSQLADATVFTGLFYRDQIARRFHTSPSTASHAYAQLEQDGLIVRGAFRPPLIVARAEPCDGEYVAAITPDGRNLFCAKCWAHVRFSGPGTRHVCQ